LSNTDGDRNPDAVEFRGGADTDRGDHIVATNPDTNADGLMDGLEIGVECQSYADYAARRCDRGPSTHTNPLDTDTV
jgi:hypothetical protein